MHPHGSPEITIRGCTGDSGPVLSVPHGRITRTAASVYGMAKTWVPHVKLQYGGSLGNAGLDQWSNSLRFVTLPAFTPSLADLDAACAAVVGPLSSWIARPGSNISSSAHLDFVKLNWVLATGKQRDNDTVLRDVIPYAAGGVGNNPPPWYQTFAVTFRTRTRRGRGSVGRVFPPLVFHDAPAFEQGPYTSLAKADGMTESFATLVRDLRTAMAQAWTGGGSNVPIFSVLSPGDTVAGTAPITQEIISLHVDRVPDVQHRRTNRVPRAEGSTVLLDPGA